MCEVKVPANSNYLCDCWQALVPYVGGLIRTTGDTPSPGERKYCGARAGSKKSERGQNRGYGVRKKSLIRIFLPTRGGYPTPPYLKGFNSFRNEPVRFRLSFTTSEKDRRGQCRPRRSIKHNG